GAVEGDCAHHLRLCEVARLGAQLPDACVRFFPDPADVVGDLGQAVSVVAVESAGEVGESGGGGEHLAVDIQLRLPGRTVTDAGGADFRWQRGGRGRGDRARRCVNEELECERAAKDYVLPRSVVVASISPLAPSTARRLEAGLDLSAGGQDERFLVGGAEDEQ